MKQNIHKIISKSLLYDNGFLINNKKLPFFSFSKQNNKANWSDDLTNKLQESSREHFIDKYNRKIIIDVLKTYKILKDTTYIDLGCSSGYMLENVIENFPELKIFGADYFSEGLIDCHKRLPEIPLFQFDILKPSFEKESFDIISCLNVLEHINDDNKALNQIFRILKNNGLLIATVPTAPNLYDMYDEIHYHVRRYNIDDLLNKIEKAGFKIINFNYFGCFIYPPFFLIKKINRLLYKNLSFDDKFKKALNQIKETQSSKIMEMLCNIEFNIGKKIKFPFGIRAYVIAQKQ